MVDKGPGSFSRPFTLNGNDTGSFELFFLTRGPLHYLEPSISHWRLHIPKSLVKTKTGGLDGNHLVQGCLTALVGSAGHTIRTKAGCNLAHEVPEEPPCVCTHRHVDEVSLKASISLRMQPSKG